MSQTKIEWADAVWNPVTGCTKISPGCQNCYAERMAKRLAGRCGYPADEPFKVTIHPDKLDEPLRWKKPRRVFVCSMGDLFHDDVPDDYIFSVFNTMVNAQWIYGHRFMVLTKRPERMKQIIETIGKSIEEQRKPQKTPEGRTRINMTFGFPLRNIWLGVTAEDQEQANKRIPILLQIPAAVRFVSIEPMLGPVDLSKWISPVKQVFGTLYQPPEAIKWVIAGGESGLGARPCHPDWISAVRDQTQRAGVPFFFKQHGEWEVFYDRDKDDPDWRNVPEEKQGVCRLNLAGGSGFHGDRLVYLRRVGKKAAGRLLDGREWNEFPKGAG